MPNQPIVTGSRVKRVVFLVVVVAALLAVRHFFGIDLLGSREIDRARDSAKDAPTQPTANGRPAIDGDAGEAAILTAFADERSDVWVESRGTVAKILRDDNDGSRHQRFIVRLSAGHTVLIAHNIDLAPRVPIAEGDDVAFRGEYEWNDDGGVVHWTHHDPGGRREGGWLRHQGKVYE